MQINETVKTILNFVLVVTTVVSVSFAAIKTSDARKIEDVRADVVKVGIALNNIEKRITVLERSFAVIDNELKHITKMQEEILTTIKGQ